MSEVQLFDETLLGWCAEQVGGTSLIDYSVDPRTPPWTSEAIEEVEAEEYRVSTDWRPVHRARLWLYDDRSTCTAIVGGADDGAVFAERARARIAGLNSSVVTADAVDGTRRNTTYEFAEKDIMVDVLEYRNMGGGVTVLGTVRKR